jgi:hypothetical protein
MEDGWNRHIQLSLTNGNPVRLLTQYRNSVQEKFTLIKLQIKDSDSHSLFLPDELTEFQIIGNSNYLIFF